MALKISDVTLIRWDHTTLQISVRPDGTVRVKAPLRAAEKDIEAVLQKKDRWIRSRLSAIQAAQKAEPITAAEIRRLADRAVKELPPIVQRYARLLGVTYGRITIRNQKSKWGSCTSKGNLNFNCLLMLAPQNVRECVVVHELSHRVHMDHSKAFYSTMDSVFPDRINCEKWLKSEGKQLITRMEQGQMAGSGK